MFKMLHYPTWCMLMVKGGGSMGLRATVATPELGPARLASPNRNPGTLGLFLLFFVLLNFFFQKCRELNPWPNPNDGSKPEPGLLRRFQLSSQNILFGFIKFSFSKVSRPESPTRPGWRIQAGARFTPTFSIILTKHFIMSFRCGSGFNFGQAHNHLQFQCNSVGP